MGDLLSTPSSPPNPNPIQDSTPQNSNSMSPHSSETPKIKTQESETPNSKQPDNPNQETPKQDPPESDSGEGEEGEEEGECGFCLFMKAGECKEQFIAWEKCVFEAEEKKENIVEKCHGVTAALKECMEAHPDHYGPILKAEEDMEEEALDEMEKLKEQKGEKGAKESVAASGNPKAAKAN